uniref:Uncharacterized protein n=1 Tax=Romanomermis culicivorax TaxID=13658 RepID=A0A915HSC7_ROMCU
MLSLQDQGYLTKSTNFKSYVTYGLARNQAEAKTIEMALRNLIELIYTMKLLKNVVAKNVRGSIFHHNQNLHPASHKNYESSKTEDGNILLVLGSCGAFFIVLALVALFLVQKRPGKRMTTTVQPDKNEYRPLSLKDTYEKGVKPILKFVGSKDHRESLAQNAKLNDEISGVLKLQEKYKRPIETTLAAGGRNQEYRKSSDASEYVLSELRPTQMCDGRK